jgi:hypothetical protein
MTVATSSAATGLLTNVSLTDENGSVVAGPVDATWVAGVQTLTFSDTITFPTGVKTYYVQGKVASSATGGAGIVVSTVVNTTNWTNPTGQTTGNSVTLPGTTVSMNSMTVKAGTVLVSMDTQPGTQNITSGVSGFTFANVLLDAQASGEDVRLSSLPVIFTGNANNLSGCQMWDGTIPLNTSSRTVNTVTGGAAKTTFSFDNVLRISKGTTKKVAIKCNLSSAATSSTSYVFSADTSTADYSVTGDVSGVSITPNGGSISASSGGTMTVQTASIALTVHNSSPASTTVSGGSTGQTVAVYNLRASNDTATLNKLGMTLTSGTAASVVGVSLYNEAGALIGTAAFGSGQTLATSTLSTPLTLSADVDTKVTVKADFADVGVGKSGVEGAIIAINPNSSEANSTSGLISSAGSGSTSGVRLYNSYPVFTYDTTGGNGTLNNGAQQLLALTVTADSKGDIGLYKLTFTISTTTVSVTSPTFQGPNGNVASTTLTFGTNSTLLTVYFDSTTNTNDATVSAGASKTYFLGGTVSGLTTTGGVVSVALKGDTVAATSTKTAALAATSPAATAQIIWSPLATTSLDVSTTDWTNGYALTKGCYANVGLANDCNARTISK